MAYKFYSGPQGTVTVTERLADKSDHTVARAINKDLKGRWFMRVFGDPQPDHDVTDIIHDHGALSALIDKRRQLRKMPSQNDSNQRHGA